jgi:hypothetical protein
MSRTITLAGFAVIALAMLGYELAGLIFRRTPTLGDALNLVTRSRPGRWIVLGAWLWLGWHLFVRASWR